MPSILLFHFDFVSPYAYLAWKQIHAIAAETNTRVVPVPTLFAALLNASGNLGPAEIPSKREYIYRDTLRTARVLGIALRPPPSHPFNPLVALRVSSLAMDEALRRRAIDALYEATWADGSGIETKEKMTAALDRAGLPGAGMVADASSPEAKETLRKATDDAIAAGVFGVPTMRIGDDLFWGCDSLGHVARCMRGEDLLAGVDLDEWRRLAPSAKRQR